MKKLIILLMIINYSVTSAQKFELTPAGFVDIDDKSKSYVILEFPNKTKDELFKEALIYFNKSYASAKDVISKVDNEVITISAVSPYDVPRNSIHFYQNNYSIVLSFKDGKIKIDAPIVNLTRYVDGRVRTLHIFREKGDILEYDLGIFGKNDKLRFPKAKEALELFAERFVLGFKLGITPEAQNNDW